MDYDFCSVKPCRNNATCLNIGKDGDFICSCLEGFTGSKCEVKQNDSPCVTVVCQNGGKCQV